MIEVFKTNVEETAKAEMLKQILLQHFPGGDVCFDLEDCDRILRVRHDRVVIHTVNDLLQQQGYRCEVLQD